METGLIMKGIFEVVIDGCICQFTDYNDIPSTFTHVVRFEPEIPASPHTEAEHELIESYHEKFQSLMEIERHASSNPDR